MALLAPFGSTVLTWNASPSYPIDYATPEVITWNVSWSGDSTPPAIAWAIVTRNSISRNLNSLEIDDFPDCILFNGPFIINVD